VNAIIYDGIASGRKRAMSKNFLPVNFLVDINQAGTKPRIREKKTVKKTRYNVFNEYPKRRLFHRYVKFSKLKPITLYSR
jgi:hypothetical protein